MEIPETVKAYTAGLLDRASWTIMSYRSRKPVVRKIPLTSTCITFSTDNKNVVEYFQHFWEATFVTPKTKNMIVIMRGSNACHIAKTCLPYLIARRNHALLFEAHAKIKQGYCRKGGNKRTGVLGYPHHILKNLQFIKTLVESLNNEKKGYAKRVRAIKNGMLASNEHKRKVVHTYYNNIFDFFDGALSVEEATKAKSIFDELLK